MLKVILLCLILITPTIVLYQNYTVLNVNYGKLTDNFNELTINFVDLEDSFEKLDKENQQLGNENQQLGNDLNLLIADYEKSKTLLDKLEQLLEDTNNQKTELESEIKTKSSEISQLIEDGNAKQSAINSLNDDILLLSTAILTLDELSLTLESEILDLVDNIEDQEQTISNLENIENELKRQKQNLIEENEILNDNNTKLSLLLSESILGQRDEIYRVGNNIRESVVHVSDSSSYGTGFFVSSNGCILTNAHVTDGNNFVTVELSNGRKYTGTVIKEGNYILNNRVNSNAFDLALVKIEIDSVPIPISTVNPDIDEMIILVGHPGELGSWVIAAGTYNGNADDIPSEHSFSLPSVFGGSSGSPIVNMNGELVGVNWGSGLDDPLNQNDNIVVWKDNLGKLIMANQYSIAETSASAITFLSNTQCRIT
ncbi:MAG: trypsin-like peptidase domain-containing protein [Thaumarchaeota archaeon]|nr:trypsin-like peptidase domain-containing protein [Nitrososphaerota archaeon]